MTKEQFLKDVAHHVMDVKLDDGVFRHITFRKPTDGDQHFYLATWPGTLCIGGDMGTYVFQRNHDMFSFFCRAEASSDLDINPEYWGEKLAAIDAHSPECSIYEYQQDLLVERLKRELVEYFKDNREMSSSQRRELREELEGELLGYLTGDYHEDVTAVRDYSSDISSLHQYFDESWEWRVKTLSSHYLWCCYAIVWSIGQYRALPSTV